MIHDAVHTAGVIGCQSLHFETAQAIGATTPVFTAVLAVAMMGKRESGIVYAALLPVVIGIVIATGATGIPSCVMGCQHCKFSQHVRNDVSTHANCIDDRAGAEPLFDMTGFSAAVIATAMRALKSVLQVSGVIHMILCNCRQASASLLRPHAYTSFMPESASVCRACC